MQQYLLWTKKLKMEESQKDTTIKELHLTCINFIISWSVNRHSYQFCENMGWENRPWKNMEQNTVFTLCKNNLFILLKCKRDKHMESALPSM